MVLSSIQHCDTWYSSNSRLATPNTVFEPTVAKCSGTEVQSCAYCIELNWKLFPGLHTTFKTNNVRAQIILCARTGTNQIDDLYHTNYYLAYTCSWQPLPTKLGIDRAVRKLLFRLVSVLLGQLNSIRASQSEKLLITTVDKTNAEALVNQIQE